MEEGVAIGRCGQHLVGADQAGAAAVVLDHDLLPDALADRFAEDAGRGIAGPTGRVGHHQRQRPGGKVFSGKRGKRAQCAQCRAAGGTAGQLQEAAAVQ
ncbi:hypothetical protein D9M71_680600 [compost metagenome]